jgi:hypothetical protein
MRRAGTLLFSKCGPYPHERAREIMLLTEGSMALTLIHGGSNYIDAAARAAKQIVGQR